MRSSVFLLIHTVCFVALTCGADADGVDSGHGADNPATGGTLTTTKAPVAPAAPPPGPVPAPAEPKSVITTSTGAPSSSAALNQQAPLQQGQSQGQQSTATQGGQDNQRGDSLVNQDNTDGVTTIINKAVTPPADVGTLPDNTDHSSQRQQLPSPLQTPTTTTTPGAAPAQQNPTPSKDAGAGGQTDKGKKQVKTSTSVAEDMATPTVPTNSDKEINVAQTSVTSTSVPTKGESTSPTTLLPNLSNAMQHVDKKDNTIGSSSLFALGLLVTFVMITVEPAY